MEQLLVPNVTKLGNSSDSIVQKYDSLNAAPISQKCLDLMEQVRPIVGPFLNSGNYIGNDVITSFCKLIGQHVELR